MSKTIAVIPVLFITALLCLSCNSPEPRTVPLSVSTGQSDYNINYRMVNAYPHDTHAYTEGLVIHDGQLFESTGHTDSYSFSRSLFGPVDLLTGKIKVQSEIDKNKYFGEGIVFLKGKIYQLTYTTHIGFIYDDSSCKNLGSFHYDGEGWGLTTNGTSLIMSNGSDRISYLDPITGKTIKSLHVRNSNGPVSRLNELELINGYLYANQWMTSYIVKIDTSTGMITGRLDLSSLCSDAQSKYPPSAEMNGIAYDAVSDKIYVTGKLWPNIYEIKFKH